MSGKDLIPARHRCSLRRLMRSSVVPALLSLCSSPWGVLASPEEIPPDRVVHPLFKASAPALVLDSRQEPEYPEMPRKLNLGAELVLQLLIDSTGKVMEVSSIHTTVRKRTSCDPSAKDRQDEDPGEGEPIQQASKQFEKAAVKAVKRWRFHPGTMQGVPTSMLHLVILNFDPCIDNS